VARRSLSLIKKKKNEIGEIDHPTLKRKRITAGKLQKYKEQILAVFAPHLIPEALQQLRVSISLGDTKAIEHTLKAYGILKTGGDINVNQVNQNATEVVAGGYKTYDAFIRDRARDKRIVDIPPEEIGECSSSPQLPAGSET
jgi:hypothetical protein